jgi:hypothetical protein
MDKSAFIESFSFLNDGAPVAADLYFHYQDDDQQRFLLKAPTNVEEVNKKLSRIYSSSISATFSSDKDFEVLDLSQIKEADEKTTYYYYKKDYPPGLDIIFEKKTPQFKFSSHKYSFIKGFVIKLNSGKNQITLYKVRNPLDFHVKPTMLTLLRVENGFTSPSDESLILNDKFDYVLIGSTLIVMNMNQLERKYKFEERIKLHSQTIIKSLKTKGKNIVEGFDHLETFLSNNMGFAKKLNSIDFNGVLWKTDFKVIKKAIQEHPSLAKYLKFNKSGTKFNIKSVKAARIFFSLCNDLVMESVISGKVATVTEKDEIE